jgi:hypothetical protein
MDWNEIINNPSLRDLPFKIETNEWGQIVMSAATNKHGILQVKISHLIENLLTSGLAITECSVDTSKGVKVADVVWCSSDFLAKNGYETPYQESPEICIENCILNKGLAKFGFATKTEKLNFIRERAKSKNRKFFHSFLQKLKFRGVDYCANSINFFIASARPMTIKRSPSLIMSSPEG